MVGINEGRKIISNRKNINTHILRKNSIKKTTTRCRLISRVIKYEMRLLYGTQFVQRYGFSLIKLKSHIGLHKSFTIIFLKKNNSAKKNLWFNYNFLLIF